LILGLLGASLMGEGSSIDVIIAMTGTIVTFVLWESLVPLIKK
jgi:hypothetical protein